MSDYDDTEDPGGDPIEEHLDNKQKLAAQRKAEDMALYEAWKADPSPTTTEPIMKRLAPVFRSKEISWKAPAVNPAAFQAKAKSLAIEGLKTYDPQKGTALRTWVEHRLQPLKRFNVEQQNYAKIPEAKAARIGDIQGATDDLKEELGRDPTHAEIAEYVNPQLSQRQQLTPQKVQEIQAAQRRDVIGSSFESDPVPRAISRERQVIGQLRPALQPDQQEVYDYLYGKGGKKQVTSTTELAKLLGKSPSQVSRLRTAILAKYKEYE
jgi:DNA-directed RNA polymerase specialized sigma subunit